MVSSVDIGPDVGPNRSPLQQTSADMAANVSRLRPSPAAGHHPSRTCGRDH